MKKILITGANSYIGVSFEKYMEKFGDEYSVDTVDMIGDEWKNKDFSPYSVVFHVAGIAHSDNGKLTAEKEALYKNVNVTLAVETAKKAKADGVKQFVFMSSAIVYGASAPVGKKKIITAETEPSPANYYGESKLQAERGITALESETFRTVILRPPMVYGKGCKGNYRALEKFAGKFHFFPYVANERSMIYVGNLAAFVKLMIDKNESGVFFPQNDEYTNTSLMVKSIAAARGRKMRLVKGFTPLIRFLGLFTGLVNKAFGNLTYDKSLSYPDFKPEFGLEESIILSET